MEDSLRFFENLREHQDTVNELAKAWVFYNPGFDKFSDVFNVLFQNPTENVKSWLSVIAKNFQPGHKLREQDAEEAFHASLLVGVRPQNLVPALNFWQWLKKVYKQLASHYKGEYSHKPKFDRIFGFMEGFRIDQTRAVIIGSDPSGRKQMSKGYAFHGVQAPATKYLVQIASSEYSTLCGISNGDHPFNFNAFRDAVQHCDLGGWVEQGVLMLNWWFAFEPHAFRYLRRQVDWMTFSKFLIKQLCRQTQPLVFILFGNIARNAFTHIESGPGRRHLVIDTYHPAWYAYPANVGRAYPTSHWRDQLPFANANYFLYRNQLPLIDWNSLSKLEPAVSAERQLYLRNVFETLEQFATGMRRLPLDPFGRNIARNCLFHWITAPGVGVDPPYLTVCLRLQCVNPSDPNSGWKLTAWNICGML